MRTRKIEMTDLLALAVIRQNYRTILTFTVLYFSADNEIYSASIRESVPPFKIS